MDKEAAKNKKEELLLRLNALGSLMVAFSGGVDSTFLLAAAHEALGDKVLAATSGSRIHPSREIAEARHLAQICGVRHIVFQSDEMDLPEFTANPAERCYTCKKNLFKTMLKLANEQRMECVAHGANCDDLKDYRPGSSAAHEMGILAPLIEARLAKEEIRFLSREMGLPTWNKPPMPCLATRIPYGSAVTDEKLRMIEEAESKLFEMGFKDVRVRHHGPVARIEVGSSELERLMFEGSRENIVKHLRKIGFEHVALDLEGYLSGKMNRSLGEE